MSGLDLDALAHLDVPEFIVRHTTMRQLQIFEKLQRNANEFRRAKRAGVFFGMLSQHLEYFRKLQREYKGSTKEL